MIIINFTGGLGNQMFQYAFGRALSIKTGIPLAACVDFYGRNPKHNGFELTKVFELDLPFCTKSDLERQTGFFTSNISVRKLINKIQPSHYLNRQIITESKYIRSLNSARLLSSGYYLGYWQNPVYFDSQSDLILKDFSSANNHLLESRVLSSIESTNSVGMHIRRGDYVNEINAAKVHGFCGLDYYTKSMKFLSERFSDLTFYVFSDDPDWAAINLKKTYGKVYIVRDNVNDKSFIDLLLMSKCKHNIISNSTFSWWGGWLNSNPAKVILAPARWYSDGRSCSILPTSWIKIDNA